MKPSGIYAAALHSTSIYAIGIVLSRAVSILLLPLYTRYLTASDYGILELVDVTMTVFALVVGARVSNAVAYFCAKANSELEKSSVYTTNLIGSTLATFFAVVVGWMLSSRLGAQILGVPGSSEIFRLGVVGFALSFPAESFLARLRVENRPVYFISIQLARLFLAMGLNVYLIVVAHLGFRAILWSNIVCNLVISAYGAFVTFRSCRTGFSSPLFLAMLKFAVPVGAVGLSLFVFHVADRFFLRRYSTLAEIGLYSLGYKLGMLITYAGMAFSQYWSAQSYEMLKGERGPAVFSRVFTYFLAVVLLAAVATWVFAAPALRILTTAEFRSCIVFVPWIIVAYLFRLVAEYLRAVLYTSQRPGLDAIVNSSSAVFCLLAYWLLIPRYGAMGAAWATAATSVVMLILSAYYSRRVFPVRFEPKPVAVLSAGAAAVVALQRLFPTPTLPLQLLSGAAACALFLGVVVWFGAIGSGDRQKIQAVVRARFASAS